jgi:hypothetical protein
LKPEDKPGVKEVLQSGIEALAELQDVLYAQDRWSVLLIFQAMDAAGKDGAIKHVMSGVNPQGCAESAILVGYSEILGIVGDIVRVRVAEEKTVRGTPPVWKTWPW